MVYVALAEAVCIVALATVLYLVVRASLDSQERLQLDFRDERADLVNAARRPHLLIQPRQAAEPAAEPDEAESEHARNLALIGRVQT